MPEDATGGPPEGEDPGAKPPGAGRPEARPLRRIGRFELAEEIGRGATAVVYKAHDSLIQRTVALKVIEPSFVPEAERAAFEARFLGEARLAGRLVHAGIVVVHDVGADPETGRLFMALEHVEGPTADRLIQGQVPLAWREALRITGKVAEALHYAHEQGVVHRDVKPENILVPASGRPKIMDFGMARLAPAGYGTAGTSRMMGNPLYLSPEQASSQEGDRRTDIFSLGAVAYRLLTGRDAFAADSVPAVLGRILRDDPVPPSQVVPSIPRDVNLVVARALAKRPRDRYSDARSLAEDVEDLLAGVPPRHSGEATVRSGGAVADDTTMTAMVSPPTVHEGTWFPGEQTAVRRRGSRRMVVGAALLLGVAALHLLRRGDRPAFGPPEGGRPAASAALPPPLLPEGAEEPAGEREPPVLAPTPTPPPARTGLEASLASLAIVTVDFRHSLESGRLRVYVDGALSLDRGFRGRAARRILFKSYRGTVRESLRVAPGPHEVRVSVHWDGRTASGTTRGGLRAASQRRLRIELKRGARLSLEWQ